MRNWTVIFLVLVIAAMSAIIYSLWQRPRYNNEVIFSQPNKPEVFQTVNHEPAPGVDIQYDHTEPKLPTMEMKSDKVLAMYHQYQECLWADIPCEGYTTESPNAYAREVLTSLHVQLAEYYNQLKEHPERITADDQTLAAQLVADAFAEMQLLGLRMLRWMPLASEILSSVVDTVSKTLDEDVLDEGLTLLKERKDTNLHPYAAKIIQEQLLYGISDRVAVAAAKQLAPLLDKNSYENFVRIKPLITSQTRRSALEKALTEYALLNKAN